MHVDPLYVDIARFAYANAFEFGHMTFLCREFPPPLNFSPIGLRAPGGLTLGFAPNLYV